MDNLRIPIEVSKTTDLPVGGAVLHMSELERPRNHSDASDMRTCVKSAAQDLQTREKWSKTFKEFQKRQTYLVEAQDRTSHPEVPMRLGHIGHAHARSQRRENDCTNARKY